MLWIHHNIYMSSTSPIVGVPYKVVENFICVVGNFICDIGSSAEVFGTPYECFPRILLIEIMPD
jgi:hypothetical protein